MPRAPRTVRDYQAGGAATDQGERPDIRERLGLDHIDAAGNGVASVVDAVADAIEAAGGDVKRTDRGVAFTVDVDDPETDPLRKAVEALEASERSPIFAHIPHEAQFDEVGYLAAEELTEIAHGLIAECQELYPCKSVSADIEFLWRKASRKAFGKVTATSDLLAHFSGARFVCWIAADRLREWKPTEHQVEALVFHFLSRIDWDEKRGHFVREPDVIAFQSELNRFGLWSPALRSASATIAQLRMELVDEDA